jgi:2-methylcitrate dehydratase PrpD
MVAGSRHPSSYSRPHLGQTSVQYPLAAPLVDGQFLMAQFSAGKLNKPLLRQLMAKIVHTHHTELDSLRGEWLNWRTNMTVKFWDGTKFKEKAEVPRGCEQ